MISVFAHMLQNISTNWYLFQNCVSTNSKVKEHRSSITL